MTRQQDRKKELFDLLTLKRPDSSSSSKRALDDNAQANVIVNSVRLIHGAPEEVGEDTGTTLSTRRIGSGSFSLSFFFEFFMISHACGRI